MPPTLSDDEKRAVIEQRLKAFAVDTFGHELNRQVALATGDADAAATAAQAIATIAVCADTYQQELNALPTPEPSNPPPAP